MKHTVKMLRVERKKAGDECLQFLKNARVCNMYLYEGIGSSYPLFHNYSLVAGDRIIGILHTKNGVYLHLYLIPKLDLLSVRTLAHLVQKKFQNYEMLFGDERSVSLFFEGSSRKPYRTVRFTFMETDYAHFTPAMRYRGSIPSPDDAPLLLPLQIQYEIEEIGASRDQIEDRKVLSVLTKKIRRGEISALYHGNIPVAIAGVNARFESCCQIGSVYVLPEFRGKGYGKAIVSYHVGRLLKRYDRIVLFVHETNIPALHIYERLGFERTGVLVQAYV